MKSLILICLFLIPVAAVFGQQDSQCPTVTNNKNADIAKVTGFNSDLKKDFTCHLATISGAITGLLYDEDTSDAVSGLVIQSADGSRHSIYFSDENYFDCFSHADKGNWKAQLIKSAKVTVKAFACGAGGKGDLVISSIEFLPKRRSNITKRK